MAQYGIDKFTLAGAGIPREVIDRVYRSLFVYSTGFHQMLTKLLTHTQGKYSVIKSIWRTFAVLLEYCCKTDYESLLNDIDREHKEQQEETFNMYHQEIKDLKLSEESLKATVDALKTHMDKFEKEAYNEKRHRIKAEEEYESMKENIENEVGLRMKFEDKVGDHEL